MLKSIIFEVIFLLQFCSNLNRSPAHFLPLLNNGVCNECFKVQNSTKDSENLVTEKPPQDISNFGISPSSIFAYLTWNNPSSNFQFTRILRRSDTFPNSPTDPLAILVYQGTGTEYLDGILTHQTTYFYTAYTFNGVEFSQGVQLQTTTQKSGDLDLSFVPSSVATVKSLFIQSDKKILVAGSSVRRLLPDGQADTSFSVGTVNIFAEKILQHLNGKIYVFGNFTTYNSIPMKSLVRLNENGSVDSSFNIGTGTNNSIFDAHVYPNESILIVGSFTFYNSNLSYRIRKLLPDGSIDSSFIIGTGFTSSVLKVTVQQDGKIFLTGTNFTHYNGTPRNRIARLHPNGTLDTSLPIGTSYIGPNDTVRSHLVLEDGKYLIAGPFTLCNSTSVPKIARLNPDGSLDSSFTPGLGVVSGNIWNFLRLPNGKIIIGGSFTIYDSVPRNGIARLNENGSLDTEFDPGTGANDVVYDLKFTHDGRILIGGSFTNYNGNAISGVAKVYP